MSAPPRPTFPLAEGLGIFIGVVAWDLLVDGHMELFKAIVIAAFSSLVWFGVRYWSSRSRPHR